MTGGGDVFETESLLEPFGGTDLGDNLLAVNLDLWSRGLGRHYLVFHRGIGGLSAVSQRDGTYAQLDEDSFRETRQFESFDRWYEEVLRDEYAQRYRLSAR